MKAKRKAVSERYKKEMAELHRVIARLYRGMTDRVKRKESYTVRGMDISFEQFCNFCESSDLKAIHQQWISSDYDRRRAPSVDRIDNTQGYFLANIQIIPFGENVIKQRATDVPLKWEVMGITLDQATQRYCYKCETVRPLENFVVCRKEKTGRAFECRNCLKVRRKKYQPIRRKQLAERRELLKNL